MKNKYDIIKKRYNKIARWGLRQVPGTLKLGIKAIRAGNSNSIDNVRNFELSLVKYIDKLIPKAEEASNLLYENIKDIDKMSPGELMIRLQNHGIDDMSNFILNYNKKRKNVIRSLYLFSFLKENKIELDYKSADFCLKIMSGQTPTEAYLGECKDFLVDDYNDINFEGDVNVYDLPVEIFQKIEAYHNRYMQENIYTSIMEDEYTDKEVLDFSEKAFKK